MKTRFGGIARCCVCGRLTLIYVKEENLRESCFCIKCKSKNRQRQLAYVCCQTVASAVGRRLSSLRDFARLDNFFVYNTESHGALHNYLAKMENYICSEYFGNSHKSGDIVNGIMHQDLTNLSLSDESVDLVISSDVLEHIPNPYKAHEQLYRILRKGGRHVFTVPFNQTESFDEDRATIDNNGNTSFLKEPIYHVDPLRAEGALVYKIFSREMLFKLQKIGFRTNLYHLYKPFYGIFGSNAIVFEALKE